MFSLLGMVVFLISIEGAGVSMHVEPVKNKKRTQYGLYLQSWLIILVYNFLRRNSIEFFDHLANS